MGNRGGSCGRVEIQVKRHETSGTWAGYQDTDLLKAMFVKCTVDRRRPIVYKPTKVDRDLLLGTAQVTVVRSDKAPLRRLGRLRGCLR